MTIRHRAVRIIGTAALAAGVAVSAAGCGQQDPNIRVVDTAASGDGVLKLGLLLESTGDQKFLNDSQRAAVSLAVKEINDAGGLKGRPVEVLPVQAGEATAVAAQDFIDGGADVVIGPTDSSHAPAAIDLLSEAGAVVISPANGAAALSDYSSGGFYFRTYPSDVLEAQALARQLRTQEKQQVAIIHEDSSYGDTVSTALAEALAADGASPVTVSTAAGIPEAVAEAASASPDAVVVVARKMAQAVLEGLADSDIEPANLFLSSGATGDYSGALAAGALEGAQGLHAGSFPTAQFQNRVVAMDPGLSHLTFAAEAYDAVILAALAAADAEDDAGASIAGHLLAVSGNVEQNASGAKAIECAAFEECVPMLRDGKAIDYEGQSGPITFDSDGDVSEANFGLYGYGADNRATVSKTILVVAPAGPSAE